MSHTGTPTSLSNARHWIDGQWRDSPVHRDSFNPATGEKIGSYAVGGEADAAAAVAAAVRAFRDTRWRTDRDLRARVLQEMAGRARAPGRVETSHATFTGPSELALALRRAATARDQPAPRGASTNAEASMALTST